MERLVLANIDYRRHTSSEGDELQRGLEHAGWRLCGAGYGESCRDVPTLLRLYAPRAIFVSDKRDWDPRSEGAYRKDVGFTGIDELQNCSGVFRACVVKDAGSVRRYHFAHCEEIGADAVLNYYHPRSVMALNPWLRSDQLVRTYHSVDVGICAALPLEESRDRAIVTGAISGAYPVRKRLFQWIKKHPNRGLRAFGHVGYGNRGCHTPAYLRLLAGYRVHVATASQYGFALRKIIESVAVGATPITNLPAYDVLPEIDGALVRVGADASVAEILEAVARADTAWDLDERLAWAKRAWVWYDWRAVGVRLSVAFDAKAALEAEVVA